MAKSNQSKPPAGPKGKRGGKRLGAGRKPRAYTSPTALTPLDRRSLTTGTPPEAIETAAQRYALASVAALVKCLEFGTSDAARVVAARAVLDRGYEDVTAGREANPVVAEVRAEARKHANLAIEVLRRIAEFGQSEGAAVAAARSLLDRGLGSVAPSKVPDEASRPLGKRERAVEDAQTAAVGAFETPSPPARRLQ